MSSQPPLYKLKSGNQSAYANNDAHKEELLKTTFKGKNVEISRFKGLGEMQATQLKETTMKPNSRTLLRVTLPDLAASLGIDPAMDETLELPSDKNEVDDLVDRLMGKNAESRFRFIQDNAQFVENIDV